MKSLLFLAVPVLMVDSCSGITGFQDSAIEKEIEQFVEAEAEQFIEKETGVRIDFDADGSQKK